MRKQIHEKEYVALKNRLDYLKCIRRVEIADALKFAVSLGDLRENAEYDAATEEYERVEREIYLLEKEIQNVEIVTKAENDSIIVGSTVILDFDGELETYVIKNSSNVDLHSISATSVLGKSILGHKVGDIISVDSLEGSYAVEIKEIH